MNYRKSTYSANGEQCVSVGSENGTVAVKDTKDWSGFTLSVGARAWSKFTGDLK
jgi:hypothetical protein